MVNQYTTPLPELAALGPAYDKRGRLPDPLPLPAKLCALLGQFRSQSPPKFGFLGESDFFRLR